MDLEKTDPVTQPTGLAFTRGGAIDLGSVNVSAILLQGDLIQILVNDTPSSSYVTFPDAMG